MVPIVPMALGLMLFCAPPALGRSHRVLSKPISRMARLSARPIHSRLRRMRSACGRASIVADSESIATNSETKEYFQPDPETPGYKDMLNFQEGPECDFWRRYNRSSFQLSDGIRMVQESVSSVEDAIYWGYHLGRFGFFAINGASGLALANAQGKFSPNISGTVATGMLSISFPEAFQSFKQNLEWQKKGYFKAPYDIDLRHRQYSPRFVLDQFLKNAQETSNVMGKRFQDEADTSYWVDSSLYPEYYQNTFHFQTDGWLSSDSASRYETATETIFLGRQDSMQRMTLVPFSKFLQQRREAGVTDPPKVVEVGSGTGRFATFLKDSYPEVDYTISELSPYYLEQARKNFNYFKRFKVRTDSSTKFGPTRFLQAPAEKLPFPDASQDCVISVYLFHELPPEARESVFREAARVLKSGGKFIVTDSLQKGDRPLLDEGLPNFSKLNEPFYETYIMEDFSALAEKDGMFRPDEKHMMSVSKTLSFTKL